MNEVGNAQPAANVGTQEGVDNSFNRSHQHGPLASVEINPQLANSSNGDGWYLKEGVKGEGDKPEFFNDKTFKTLADQAEAWVGARKKLSEKGGAAPDDGKYELSLGETYKDVTFQDNDPLLSKWKAMSAENKFSNEQFNAGIEMWLGYLDGYKAERDEQFVGAIKELGIDGENTIKELEGWFNNSFGDIEDFESFKEKMTSPTDIKLLMKMRDVMAGANVVRASEASVPKSREYFSNAMNRDKGYGLNQQYTKRINDEFKIFMNSK